MGSNIEPTHNLPAAVELLNARTNVLAVSNTYESAPVGYADQDRFCNAAVLLETAESAFDLKQQVLRPIEDQLGRVRDPENKNGPRTIDLDIALFNDETFDCGGQRIPDPEIETRSFLAIPLAELASDYRHPVTGQTLVEIARQFSRDELRPRPDIDLAAALKRDAIASKPAPEPGEPSNVQ